MVVTKQPTETLSTFDRSIGGADFFSWVDQSIAKALVVPFVDFRKPNRSYWVTAGEEYEALMLVKTIMESDVPKLGQNFSAYDAFWLWDRYGIKTINLLHDTRLLHHAIYPELPKDLGFMGACYTDQGPWKTMRVGKKPDKRDE